MRSRGSRGELPVLARLPPLILRVEPVDLLHGEVLAGRRRGVDRRLTSPGRHLVRKRFTAGLATGSRAERDERKHAHKQSEDGSLHGVSFFVVRRVPPGDRRPVCATTGPYLPPPPARSPALRPATASPAPRARSPRDPGSQRATAAALRSAGTPAHPPRTPAVAARPTDTGAAVHAHPHHHGAGDLAHAAPPAAFAPVDDGTPRRQLQPPFDRNRPLSGLPRHHSHHHPHAPPRNGTGTIRERNPDAGASTPCYFIRCRRGRGTNATSRCINTSGFITTCVVPQRHLRFSS